jgi:DinB superfamily
VLTVDQVLAILPDTPRRIADLTAGVAPDRLRATPDFGGWSANEVLAHLRSCADVWGGCIERILAEDRPTIRAVNPRTWIRSTDYLDLEFRPSLAAFTAQRADLLAVLERLGPDEWARSATVTGAGRVLERTVQFYAQWLAQHERSHRRQLQRIVDSVRTEPGPRMP